MKPAQLDLNKLHVFFTVVEEGGVAGAARVLGRTPSAVSQSVSNLESMIGHRLFDRTGKKLVLTRSGQLLHERFGVYQQGLARTLDEVANERGEIRGTVRIGLFLGFPRQRFASFITAFTRHHPAAGIRVHYGSAEDLAARLVKNRLDFAFAFRPATPLAGIVATRLSARELVLVSGRRFFANGFDRAELERVPLIDYYQGDPLVERWSAHHFGAGAPSLEVRVWAATTDLVLDLVLGQAGAAVLPHDLVAEHERQGRLRVLRPKRRALIDHLWLLEPKGAYRDVTLEAFRAAVIADLGGPVR